MEGRATRSCSGSSVSSQRSPLTCLPGLELRRHQVDALAGMLTELIAANQRQVEAAFANGELAREGHENDLEEEEEDENGF